MIGKTFENKHNGKIMTITELIITDDGNRYWRGEKIDDPNNWHFYTKGSLEIHWVDITSNYNEFKMNEEEE
mgnify:CR=1 FL=1|tara:strand:+ start:214 stop:426 length:213 start_codon:yes stop_codon:yes gene_type:complete